jgi:type IV secretory pathway VirB3-like protein
MFVDLIVMLIESLIENIIVFLVSIDYYEYFEVVSIIHFYFYFFLFFDSTYFRCCIIFSKQAKKTKIRSKSFLKAFKISPLPISR